MADENAFVTALMEDNARLRKELTETFDRAVTAETRKSQREHRLEWTIYRMCKEAGGNVEFPDLETRIRVAGKEERLFIEWEDYDRELKRVRITTVDEVPHSSGILVSHPRAA